MKKSLLYALLLMGGIAGAQNISIPDANFKSKLVNASPNMYVAVNAAGQNMIVDVNHDGEIQQSEADAVYELYLFGSSISSLSGISSFTNLTKLDCSNNQIQSLDVAALSNLKSLNCRVNGMQSLNMSGLALLEDVIFEWNAITSFAPTGLTNLRNIQGRNNNLTTLNLSLFPALVSLVCDNNQLTALNASVAPLLTVVLCNKNQITNLNLTGLDLVYLDYSDNPLPAVDLSSLANLETLICSNVGTPNLNLNGLSALKNVECSNNPISVLNTEDLTALEMFFCEYTQILQLDLSHSPNLKYFHAGNNPLLTSINIHNEGLILYPGECNLSDTPSLQMLCVDEGEEELMLEYYESRQEIPPYVSTTCEFVPGQIYNKISGKIRIDIDDNGCTDADTKPFYYPVKISDGTTEKIKFASSNGEYFALVGAGTYTVTAPYDGNMYETLPATASVTFAGMDNDTFVQDFCVTPTGEVNDVSVILSTGPVRPGFDSYHYIYYRNSGNTIANGTVTFTFNDAVLDYVEADPLEATSAPGSLTWNYTNLMPFESRVIMVALNANSPTETPALNIDDELFFVAEVDMDQTDVNLKNNIYRSDISVVGAFDPNNIICLEGDKEPVENIGEYLNYVVNFENTGNAAATFVVVTQELDAAQFDVSSFEVLNASHEVDVTRIGNNVMFRFEDIDLGAAEQGNVVFRIKTLQSLEEGDQVTNQANIVFDYNYAIITNQAFTTFETILGNDKFTLDKSVSIYPNPSTDLVNISSENDVHGIELYDIQGRLVQAIQINAPSAQIDLTDRQSGIYFIKIATAKGVMVEKVIKR